MSKSLNELVPEYVRNLFTRCSDSNGRVLRSTDTDLKLPLLKTSAAQKSFSYRGARLWNSLSRETNVAPSLSAFKRLSKVDINTLKALIQPECLARVASWLAFVVTIFMGHENGDNKGQLRDDASKACWLNKSL